MVFLVRFRVATLIINRVCPGMSRKRIFVAMTGICVLGIIILTFYSRLLSLTSTLASGTSWNRTDNRNLNLLNAVTGNSQNGQPNEEQLDDNHNIPTLNSTTGSEPLLYHQFINVSANGNLSTISDTKVPEKSQVNHDIDLSTEVHPITTTMTFNETLVVHCKETPYIECGPPVARKTSDKMFKISLLRQPSWHTKQVFNVSLCLYKQCQFVHNQITAEADLVVVYGGELTDDLKPPRRWSHQLYAISVWEPPTYTRSSYIRDANFVWNKMFNLTITYRVDSDIFTPYCRLRFNPKPLDKRPNYYDIAKSKTKTAIWMVSHCKVQSKRLRYIEEMKKYIDVDIFGKCGQPCSKHNTSCDKLPSNYKFYLSFENSFCTDYVTEKFFKLFLPGMHVIPVVRGGADYDKYFPNFTFINAAHFKSPKYLALHLKNLAADLETYSKYLEYKDLYLNPKIGIDLACRICEYLHTHDISQQKTYDLKASIVDGQCQKPTDIW